MVELEKIEILRKENGGVSLYVNGEGVDLKDVLGIHIDVNHSDDATFIELTERKRIGILK